MKRGLLTVLVGFLLAPAAHGGGPSILVGTAEDSVKQSTFVLAESKVVLARLAGFDAVRVTSTWAPGLTAPNDSELTALQNVAGAAELNGMRVLVAVSSAGSGTTPLTDEARAEFAQYAASIARSISTFRDFIIGNEPNLNRFWMPQFNLDGSDAAATAYEALLAEVYDALKAVSPATTVIGGALSPRGQDKLVSKRQTHSPTTFIADLGAAYRATGRALPIMDALAIHPYGDNSSQPPSFAHPNSTTIALADYDKLVALLGRAFDGTAQPGSNLPIVYSEYGIESAIPEAEAGSYAGAELPVTRPVDEETQGAYYRQAFQLAFCQPNVRGLFLFHVTDERSLDRFQSGVYYADGTPKSSLADVQSASRDVKGGVITSCPGLGLTPKATVAYPRGAALAEAQLGLQLECNIDCVYRIRLEKLPRHSTTLATSGRVLAGTPTKILLPPRRIAPADYRFTVRLTAPVNPGPPLLLASPAVRIRYPAPPPATRERAGRPG